MMKRLLLALALLFAGPAWAQTPINMYWPTAFIVVATNPTQAYKASIGAYVANNDASYVAWVGNCTDGTVNAVKVVSKAAGTGGVVQLTLTMPVGATPWANGDYVVVTNVSTDANGTRQLQNVNQTAGTVELVGTTYSSGAAFTPGCFGAGFKFATEAAMYASLDAYNCTVVRSSLNTIASPGTITLTNPLAATQVVNVSGSVTITLPPMNLPGSLPIGAPLTWQVSGGSATIKASDGTSLVTLYNTETWNSFSPQNSSAGGPVALLGGRTNYIGPDPTIAGQVPIAQGSTWFARTISGDCTLTNTGAITCTKTSGVTTTGTIATGAKALGTSAIASGACTAAQTAAATGTLTTDVIIPTFGSDPTGITGYMPSTNGMLTIIYYPTADTVNFKQCNNTNAIITPGALMLNWKVIR